MASKQPSGAWLLLEDPCRVVRKPNLTGMWKDSETRGRRDNDVSDKKGEEGEPSHL